MKRRNLLSSGWRHLYAWILILFSLFPIYVVVVSSFDPAGGLATSSLIPKRLSFDNYLALFKGPSIPYGQWMLNSIYISAINAVISLFIGSLAAFAFSRLRFRGRKVGLQALLLIQVNSRLLSIGLRIYDARIY